MRREDMKAITICVHRIVYNPLPVTHRGFFFLLIWDLNRTPGHSLLGKRGKLPLLYEFRYMVWNSEGQPQQGVLGISRFPAGPGAVVNSVLKGE